MISKLWVIYVKQAIWECKIYSVNLHSKWYRLESHWVGERFIGRFRRRHRHCLHEAWPVVVSVSSSVEHMVNTSSMQIYFWMLRFLKDNWFFLIRLYGLKKNREKMHWFANTLICSSLWDRQHSETSVWRCAAWMLCGDASSANYILALDSQFFVSEYI